MLHKEKKRTKEVRSLLHNWAETTKNYKNNTIIIRVTKYLGQRTNERTRL